MASASASSRAPQTLSLDPLYLSSSESAASWRAGLPTLLSPVRAKADAVVVNDIDAENWLSEIAMSQYLEVFLVNFSDSNSRLLNRKRLAQVRMDYLPKMGITQYSHQRLIMEHIRHTLQFEFNSPIRKREVQAKMQTANPASVTGGVGKFKVGKLPEIPERQSSSEHAAGGGGKKFADHHKQAAPTRRRSFDKNVWQSITKLRTNDASSLVAVEALRGGQYDMAEKMESKHNERRRRRRSFGEDPTLDSSGRHKGHAYGNAVHSYGLMQQELHELQTTHLAKLRRLVKCEHASIYFINEKTRELLLVSEGGIWFRIAHGSGIAGYCVEHGETVNVQEAYNDPRFNSNLDEKTGWRTRNILCQPLRGQRGGGAVIGAVQCINKDPKEGTEFDASDAEHLAVCCQRIADDLHVHFQDLLHIAENVAGIAVFVSEKGGNTHVRGGEEHKVTQPTAASTAGSRAKDTHVSEPVWK